MRCWQLNKRQRSVAHDRPAEHRRPYLSGIDALYDQVTCPTCHATDRRVARVARRGWTLREPGIRREQESSLHDLPVEVRRKSPLTPADDPRTVRMHCNHAPQADLDSGPLTGIVTLAVSPTITGQGQAPQLDQGRGRRRVHDIVRQNLSQDILQASRDLGDVASFDVPHAAYALHLYQSLQARSAYGLSDEARSTVCTGETENTA